MKKSSFVSLFTILLLAVADVQEWTISSQSTVLNPSNTTTLLSTEISPSLYLSQNQNNAKNQTNNNDYKWLKFISEWKTIGSISGLLVLVFGVKSFPELVKLYKKKQIQRHRTQLHNTLKQLNEEESGELKDAFIKCIDETIDHKKILSDIFTDFFNEYSREVNKQYNLINAYEKSIKKYLKDNKTLEEVLKDNKTLEKVSKEVLKEVLEEVLEEVIKPVFQAPVQYQISNIDKRIANYREKYLDEINEIKREIQELKSELKK